MLSMNLKRKVAVLLTGVMVLGMSVTAFAETPASPWNVAQTGTGSFEGHVDREVLAVDLPTIKAGHTPFNYTLDAEGLIPETKAVAYGGEDKFDDLTNTTNVYFLQEDDKYYNESQAYTVSNNSSVSINVAVKVSLPAAVAGDAELVEKAEDIPEALASEDAKLYLGLKVGDKEVALKAGDTVSINKMLLSGYNNYEVVSLNSAPSGAVHGYDFVISQNKVATNGWDDVAFSLVGKANKVLDAEGVTAPQLSLTWEYSKYEAPAAPVVSDYTVTFNSNGGSAVDTQTVASGETANEPTAPTKDGKNFGGWYVSETFEGEAFDFSTPIDADITLNAKWNDPVAGFGALMGSNFYLASAEDGFEASPTFTDLKVNGVDVQNIASVVQDGGYFIKLSAGACISAGLVEADEYVFTFKIDGVYYQCTVADA